MAVRKKSVLDESYTEKDYLKLYDIKILILSRGRSGKITTNRLLPDYIELLVPESELNLYASVYTNPILTIPDSEQGLGCVRNWVLEHFSEKTVIMIDDDIQFFYVLTGEKAQRVEDAEKVLQIIINTAVMANDLGVCVFGYTQTDIRKYKGFDPFSLKGWVGCIIGVIGRKYRFRDDKYKVDIDYCLQTLLNERIVWMDNRYYTLQNRDNNSGGNSLWRTEAEFEESIETLKEKWKGCIRVTRNATQVTVKLNFHRKVRIVL